MEEDWYTVEQQIRQRLTEARAAARIRILTQKLAPPARRPNSSLTDSSNVANCNTYLSIWRKWTCDTN
jgi:hypothetical protein